MGKWLQAIALTMILMISLGQNPSFAEAPTDGPVVEWLTFAVPQAEQAKFIEKELEIWNPIDRRSPAFVRKEIWQDPENPDQLTVVVSWSSQSLRKTISPEAVQAAEKAFDTALGKTYMIAAKKEFRNLSVSEP
ncbi:TIGR03792 family protein [Picosynechococcus sp. NKBG15041c]|uniref:TIGR03792 family protein n=1 Tax=Picosynechococcus sp. NKBG15041c TaxID=1407650 RepID=UPI0003F84C13|nr:TIGR03792 family protein [Picosynechococcus sp. NKBG15041c]